LNRSRMMTLTMRRIVSQIRRIGRMGFGVSVIQALVLSGV
jgi:hypothetical protein